MFLSRIIAVISAFAISQSFSSPKPDISIFQALRSDLASRRLDVGVNLKTGEVVGTGVCEGGDRPYERARLKALADIVSLLNGSSFASVRTMEISDDTTCRKEMIDIASSGYLIGAEEVTRIVRQSIDGVSVAVAFRWSVAMQERAMSNLLDKEGDTAELESELQRCDNLEKRGGPVVWTCSSGKKRFLGIATFKISGTTPRELLSAMRLAKMKAQGHLAEHFKRIVVEELHLREEMMVNHSSSVSKTLSSFLHELKSKTNGTLGRGAKSIAATDYGVSEVFSAIKAIGDVKYAISVCCLTTKDMTGNE